MKLAGLLFLLFAGVGGGFLAARNAEKATIQTEETARLLRFLAERIETLREPLPDIFAAFSSPALTGCGFLPAYPEAPEAALRGTMLSARLSGELLLLAKETGGIRAAEAAEAVRRVLVVASREAEELRRSLPARKKTALTLGVSGWLLALLLLW